MLFAFNASIKSWPTHLYPYGKHAGGGHLKDMSIVRDKFRPLATFNIVLFSNDASSVTAILKFRGGKFPFDYNVLFLGWFIGF